MNIHYLLRQDGWLDDDLSYQEDNLSEETRMNIDDSVTVGWYKLSDPEDIPTFPSISLLTHEDTLSTKRKDTLSTKRKDRFKRIRKYNRWNTQCSALQNVHDCSAGDGHDQSVDVPKKSEHHEKKSRSKNDRYSRGKEYVRKSVNPKVDYSKYRKNKTKDSEIYRSKSCNSDKSVNVTGI